LLSWLRS